SKAFHGVQEQSTMQRYAKYWSRLVIFLLRAIDTDDEDPFALFYFDTNPVLRQLVQTVASTLHATLAIDLVDIDLEDLFSIGAEVEDDEARLHAKELTLAIAELSFHLVRFEYDESPFASPIIGFMALNTLEKNGAWIAAHNFTFVLSGMIHCMQLWLLGYCYEAKSRTVLPATLKTLVREQFTRFQINTTATPIAELSFWRLLTWTASNDTVRHPVTTMNADCTQVTHLGIELSIGSWRQALQDLYQAAETVLQEDLLLDLPEVPVYSVASMVDTPSDNRPGKCFLDDPRNRLHAVEDFLFKQLQGDPALVSRFFRSNPVAPEEEPDSSTPSYIRQSVVNSYLHANQRFLRLLAVLIYWTTGLPPRRKEFVQVRWCNTEVARNLYILDGSIVIITGYHKSQWRIGTRPIARFLPERIGDLLVRYLIYIPSFLRFLYHCMQYVPCKGCLFCDHDGTWPPARFGSQLKSQSTRLLGFPISSRQWRHIAIALDRRLYAGRACKVYGVIQQWDRRALHAVDQSDSEIDADYCTEEGFDIDPSALSRTRNFQASHTPATGQSTYGNDVTLTLGLTDTLLAAYREVSQFWFRSIACFDSFDLIASNHKRPRSLGSLSDSYTRKTRHHRGSSLAVRRQIWKWPVIEQVLQRLFGLHAAPRNLDQRDGFLLVARSRPEAIIVLPTGSGKTLLFIVASQLPGAQVTIVIVPLIALKQDLRQRCTAWGIVHAIYDPCSTPQQLHAVPTLLLVDIETAVTPGFLSFARALHAIGRLDRFVLDEAHLLLTASYYRTQLPAVAGLRRVHVPFICMTGTLPPFASSELEKILYFTHCERLRASSDRPNLEYCVQSLGAPPTGSGHHEHLLKSTVAACMQDIKQWSSRPVSPSSSAARGICFVRVKTLGDQLAKRLGCQFYHGDLSHLEREKVVIAWSQGVASNQGSSCPFIVATSALSAGVHYPSVRRVFHVDAPDGLLNYGQETGRAGRDGLHAKCTVLLAEQWAVSWNEQYHNNFLVKDRSEMTGFLRFDGCRRRYLTAYLDGGDGTACSIDRVACDHCSRLTRDYIPLAASPTMSLVSTASNHSDLDMAVLPPTSSSSSEADIATNALDAPAVARSLLLPATLNLESSAPASTPTSNVSGSRGRMQHVATKEDSEEEGSVSSREDSLPSQPLQPSLAGSMQPASMQEDAEDEDDEEDDDEDEDDEEEEEAYDIAAQFARNEAMEKEECLMIYEQQLATWGRACILCSFDRKELIEGPHPDCMQETYEAALKQHRRTPRFDNGAACFHCAQPFFACKRSLNKGSCLQPWMAWHASWVACNLDDVYGPQLLAMLGAPQRPSGMTQAAHRYQQGRWLGQASTLFDRRVSNMARVSFYWFDRMQSLCMQ
ncbi:MAG: hypothetical protein Q9218_005217, partial [Villophora microphyllina]